MEDDEEELCCATALSETARAAVRRVRRRERWEGFWGTMTIRLTDQVYGKRGLDFVGNPDPWKVWGEIFGVPGD